MTTTFVALAGVALLGVAYFSLRYAWWRTSVDYAHPRILMYHMIRERLPGGRFNKLRVAPGEFERQLKWLRDNGWRFAFLSELGERPLEANTAAHPLLLKYGAKATLFLVVDRFDRDWSTTKKAHHDSGELMREAKLSDAEVREMLDTGAWELGAHTLTHALLPGLDDEAKRHEVVDARTELERTFDTTVSSFAYPFGIFGDDDVAVVASSGYRHAVTTDAGINTDLNTAALRLERVKVSGKEGRLGFSMRLRTGRRGVLD